MKDMLKKLKSEYLDRFIKLAEAGSPLILKGASLYVELIDEVGMVDGMKKSKGGIILAQNPDQRLHSVQANQLFLGVVLYSGLGYYDAETDEREPCELQPGMLVLLPKTSLDIVSTFPGLEGLTANKLCRVKETNVIEYYKSEDDYMKTVEILNS
jgi:hypothetical protein